MMSCVLRAIRLENSVGSGGQARSGTGNGLSSLRERLALLHGDAATLTVHHQGGSSGPRRFGVEVALPVAAP